MCASVLLFLIMLWNQESVRSVRLLDMRVPGHAAAGGEALLYCQFDMEGDVLYSVKWYKNGREFYRYVPKNRRTVLVFPASGVSVDMSRSSSDVVTLVNLNPDTSGLYRCEVSGEGPLFYTVADEHYITVHVLPQTGPKVTGLRSVYRIGDTVNANCTSPGSKPEAQLRWFVNDRPVTKEHIQGPWHRYSDDPPDATETTLQLKYKVRNSHFKRGAMDVKCQATIAPLYQQESLHSILKYETRPDPNPLDLKPQTSVAEDWSIDRLFEDNSRDIVTEDYNLETTTVTEDGKGYASLTEKSFAVMMITLLLQVIILDV